MKENTKSSAGQRRILPEHERLIRLAALLHDVAHIPFGHTLEDETRVVSPRHDEDQDRRTRLLTESEIGRKVVSAIGREEFDLLMRILQAKHEDIAELGEHAYISDIVNNTVCADLLDYLKRDVYFCNLQQSYGERFLKYLYLDYPPENDGDSDRSPARRLIVRLWKEQAWRHRRDVLSELVDLLRVRYYLGEKVYFHHAKISSSAMIARAVWSAMRDGHDPSIRLEDLYHIGDDELLFTLTESKRSVVSTLTQKLLRRDLYKWVYTLSRLEAEAARGVNWSQQLVDDYHLDPNNRTQVEDQLANLCRLEPGDVLIYCPGLDMAGKYARMLVQWKNEYKQLKDVGDEATKGALDAISRSHELLWGLHVFVEPSVFRDSPRQIETLRELCHCKFDPESYAGDRERRLASLVRDLVCEQMGDRGTPALANAAVELVLSKNRGPNPGGPNSAQIAQAIHEVLGGEPGEE